MGKVLNKYFQKSYLVPESYVYIRSSIIYYPIACMLLKYNILRILKFCELKINIQN